MLFVVNMNERVSFILTTEGQRLIDQGMIHPRPMPAKDVGEYSMPLWEFCKAFGARMTMAGPQLIEANTIEFFGR